MLPKSFTLKVKAQQIAKNSNRCCSIGLIFLRPLKTESSMCKLLGQKLFWMMKTVFGKNRWVEVIALIVGTVVLYAFGTAWFLFVYARTTGSIGVMTALASCVFPFIVPDLMKMSLAFILARRLAPAVRVVF